MSSNEMQRSLLYLILLLCQFSFYFLVLRVVTFVLNRLGRFNRSIRACVSYLCGTRESQPYD